MGRGRADQRDRRLLRHHARTYPCDGEGRARNAAARDSHAAARHPAFGSRSDDAGGVKSLFLSFPRRRGSLNTAGIHYPSTESVDSRLLGDDEAITSKPRCPPRLTDSSLTDNAPTTPTR